MNCINLESPGKVFPGAAPSDRPNRSLAAFIVPCGGSPWRIVRAGRPALASLAKRSGIGNQNRNDPRPWRGRDSGARTLGLDRAAQVTA